MADSTDRVFAHALRSISRLRDTTSPKPPIAARLQLYGLYKQATEGDVPGPHLPASSPREADKHAAWAAQAGLGKTEAKRRYVQALVDTMRAHAAGTEEARALLAELEFVWEQVKGNAGGSESGEGMRRLRPGGEGDEVDDEDEDEDEDEFVDAPISQFGEDEGGPVGQGNRDVRWRRRIEAALVRTTTELAALRELLESKRFALASRRPRGWLGWALSGAWFLIKLAMADALLLWLLVLYLRRRKDRRLEGAIRVMLGDAQVVAKKVATQVQNSLPKR